MFYIILDKFNILRCVATEEANLFVTTEEGIRPATNKVLAEHDMRKLCIKSHGNIGDEYNPKTREWIPRPENYPQPSEEDLIEAKIQEEMMAIAIERLKDKGELPQDYEI